MRTGTTASWTSVRENPSGVFFRRSEISRSVTYKHGDKEMSNTQRHLVVCKQANSHVYRLVSTD